MNRPGVRPRRVALGLAMIVFTMLGAWAPVGPASAQTEADRDRIGGQIDSIRAQVHDASEEEARLLREIDESSARKRVLDSKVASLESQLRTVERELGDSQRRLTAVEEAQAAAESRLGVSQAELEAAQGRLVDYAIAAYTGKTDATRYVGSLLSSATVGELAAKRSYVRIAGNTQAEVIAAGERLRDEVSDITRELVATRALAETARDAVVAERGRVQSARDEEASARAAVAAEIATTQGIRGQVVARKAEFESEIQELERRSEEIADILRQRAAGAAGLSTAALDGPGAGGLLPPIPGARVASAFGMRVHPVYGNTRMHTGVDLSASSGTPIRASGGGVVVQAAPFGGYGNATIIDHGGGVATLYAHQSSMAVSAGQRVSAGEVIGRVGCTGTCTGPHLHFEVRLNGTPVNPMPYIS